MPLGTGAGVAVSVFRRSQFSGLRPRLNDMVSSRGETGGGGCDPPTQDLWGGGGGGITPPPHTHTHTHTH